MVTTRTEIIQLLIDNNKYESYLEIGVQNGVNFRNVRCSLKVGVDPDPDSKATYHITSDEFFKLAIEKNVVYDIIFIDGLHEEYQSDRDAENALKVLSPNGYIVCHDMNPPSELHQRVPRETKQWNGDVWKTFVKLRENPDLRMYTVDCDWGCGIITRGKQQPLERTEELTYENFDKNRQRWMNLVSPEFFEAHF